MVKAPDRKPLPPALVPSTVERRTVLRWFAGATVLALGGDVLSACQGRGAGDGNSPAQPAPDGGSDAFPFQPGPGTEPVFERWSECTVDVQELAHILASWELTVDGMVGNPLALGFADLLAMKRQDQVTDFQCVEGWVVEDVPWNGVQLAQMIDLARPAGEATHLTFYSSGGTYKESLPMSVAREPRTLLAYGVAGSTLPLVHGFPLRLVVPRLYGYKNAKYLTRIEFTDKPENGYWEDFGYSYDGEVPESSLRPGRY